MNSLFMRIVFWLPIQLILLIPAILIDLLTALVCDDDNDMFGKVIDLGKY